MKPGAGIHAWMRFMPAVVALSLFVVSCAPAAPSAPKEAPTAAPAAKPAATTAPAAQPAATSATAAKPAATSAPAAKPAAPAAASPLADIVRKAGEERELVLQMNDPVRMSTPDAARQMAAGLKRAFGIDLTIKFDNALSFPASTAKALSEVKAGGAPSYDLMYQTSLSGVPLFADNLIEPFDWLKTFNWLTEKDLEYKGHALVNNTQFILPAYNTTLVKPADIPKTWEDVIDPKWKGKLSSTIYQDSWAQMAEPQVWGEERTLEYVKKLAALEPKLGRFPEVSAMVVSGETPLTALNHTYRTNAEKANGAPVEVALVEPAIVFVNVTFVPKGARHPNAAALLSAWFLSEEGQALLEQGWTATSMFKPATPAAKFAEGKKLAVPTLDFQIKNTVRLQKQYEDIVIKR